MFLNSSDNIETRPNNKYYDFTITLPKTYHIANVTNQTGDQVVWRVALCDIHLSSAFNIDPSFNIVVMTDIVEHSYLNGGFPSVLRIFPSETLYKQHLSIECITFQQSSSHFPPLGYIYRS